ncbi:Mitochondrial dicarboxylate transporter [Tulasnella sp. UAMH 9824]|nr:Mitochondrial dicarboxylate transporter [Tulasnella sp. UAMH 9824]
MPDKKPPFWFGGVAASMAAACTHPLDLAKVRMQTNKSEGPRPGMLRTLGTSISSDGIRSIYQGLTASLLRQLTYSMVRIGSYEAIKDRLTNGRKPTTSQLIISGAVAGGLGGIAGNPADIVLVRMTTDALRPPEIQRGYRHALDGVLRIVQEEGVLALMRGWMPNTIRAVLMTSSQMATYDVCKNFFLTTRHSELRMQDGLLLHAVSSGIAGFVATTDVIKSRIMARKTGSITDMMRTSLRNEGPMFLFKGWTPAFVRLGPNTVLLFVFLEQLKQLWIKSNTLAATS